MSRARFSADAEADLLAIVEFIARDNPNASREWLRSIRERCDLLAQHPLFRSPQATRPSGTAMASVSMRERRESGHLSQ